eukprot:23646-Rhodomonas_salina.1
MVHLSAAVDDARARLHGLESGKPHAMSEPGIIRYACTMISHRLQPNLGQGRRRKEEVGRRKEEGGRRKENSQVEENRKKTWPGCWPRASSRRRSQEREREGRRRTQDRVFSVVRMSLNCLNHGASDHK